MTSPSAARATTASTGRAISRAAGRTARSIAASSSRRFSRTAARPSSATAARQNPAPVSAIPSISESRATRSQRSTSISAARFPEAASQGEVQMSQSSGFSRVRLDRMHEIMAGYVERGAVAGVVALLSRHDEVHVEAIGVQDLASGAPIRRDTIFRIASMTKPIAAAAAMILVEETKLRLDEPVDRYLPELADRQVLRAIDSKRDDTVPAERPITLRD